MMSKISCIAQLLVHFGPIREMAVNFNDYFEFPLGFDVAQYTATTLATLERRNTEVFDSLYTKLKWTTMRCACLSYQLFVRDNVYA